jgi:hypothetical protein
MEDVELIIVITDVMMGNFALMTFVLLMVVRIHLTFVLMMGIYVLWNLVIQFLINVIANPKYVNRMMIVIRVTVSLVIVYRRT